MSDKFNHLECLYLNIRGFGDKNETRLRRNKFNELRRIINEKDTNVVFLNELCTRHNNNNALRNINFNDEFKDFNFYSTGNETGLLIHKNIQQWKVIIPDNIKLTNNQWSTYCKIKLHNNKEILLCAYYRSPSVSNNNNKKQSKANPFLIDRELQWIKNNDNGWDTLILNGDFNIRNTLWDVQFNENTSDKYSEYVLNLCKKYDLCVANDNYQPTHAKYNKIDGIPYIYEYNSLDLTIISNTLCDSIKNWETNSYTIYNNDQSVLDTQWIANISDHFAITYSINKKLSISKEGSKETWRLNGNWETYKQVLRANLDEWWELYKILGINGDNIDYLIERFTKYIHRAAYQSIGVKKVGYGHTAWWCKELEIIKKEVNKMKRKKHKLKNKLKRELNNKIKINDAEKNVYNKICVKLKKIRKKYGKLIRKCKLKQKLIDCHKLSKNANNSSEFYKNWNRINHKGSRNIPPLKRNDGTYTADKQEKALLCHDFFNQKAKENEYSDDAKKFHKFIDRQFQKMCNNECIHNNNNYNNNNNNNINVNPYLCLLNRPFNEQEIWNICKLLKDNNAMGPDNIHNLFIKKAKDIIIPVITKIFNLCLKYGKWGSLWKFANYCPMQKPKKDPTIIKNLRALQITSVIGRILERIITSRLLTYFQCNGFIKSWNTAYQSNKSIDDLINDLTEDIFETLGSKLATKAVFFDLSKAFDTVWCDAMLYKLNKFYGIKGSMWRLLMDFLRGRFNRVCLDGINTKWKWHAHGMPQGGPASAFLFAVYINDIYVHKNIKMTGYSDDMGCREKVNNNNEKDLQWQIEEYSQFCQYWKLCINYEKCESMIITNKRKTVIDNMRINNNNMKVINPITNVKNVINQRNKDGINVISNIKINNVNPKKRRNTLGIDEIEKLILNMNMNNNNINNINNNNNDNNNNNSDNDNKEDNNKLNIIISSINNKSCTQSEHIRYLGFFFNSRGSFKSMINNVRNKNNASFAILAKDTKMYGLSTVAIWRRGNPIIKSLIEFGLKFYTCESKNDCQKVFKIINKLARFALCVPRSTPIRYLESILNYDNMELLLYKRIMEYDEQSIRAPPTSLKYYTIRQAREYDNNRINISHYNKSKIYEKKSMINRVKDIRVNILGEEGLKPLCNKFEEKKPLQIYIIPYPNNIVIINDNFDDYYEQLEDAGEINEYSIWWTDGSEDSEHYGGFAWITLQKRSNGRLCNLYGYTNKLSDNNTCELLAILYCLKEIISDETILMNDNLSKIILFTDSKSSIDTLTINGYPKCNDTYNIINKIYECCHFLNYFQIQLEIVHVPAHVGIKGNEIADWWAKYGVFKAHQSVANNNNNYIENNQQSLIISNQINNTKLQKYYHNKKKQEYKLNKQKREKRGKISINSRYMNNQRVGKHFIKEYNLLSRSEVGIITRLRTQHIELNYYTNIIYAKGEQTSSLCKCGKSKETVYHYLMECENYSKERKEMWDTIELIDEYFKNKSNKTIKKLLFYYKDQDKAHLCARILVRVDIIKQIIKFVAKTKRFDEDNIKTFIFKNVKKKYENDRLDETIDLISDEEMSESDSDVSNDNDESDND